MAFRLYESANGFLVSLDARTLYCRFGKCNDQDFVDMAQSLKVESHGGAAMDLDYQKEVIAAVVA